MTINRDEPFPSNVVMFHGHYVGSISEILLCLFNNWAYLLYCDELGFQFTGQKSLWSWGTP